jgi:hypothetical protein
VGGLDSSTTASVTNKLAEEQSPDCAGILLRSTTWEDVYQVLKRRLSAPDVSDHGRWLLNEFMTFFREDYRMTYYDAEVLIQEWSGDSYKCYTDFHLYRRDLKGGIGAPLYFAPYLTQGGGGVKTIARVLRVVEEIVDNDLLTRIEFALKTAPKFDQEWPNWKRGVERTRAKVPSGTRQRFFFLDEPQSLPHPVKKKPGQKMLAAGFKRTVQHLLRDTNL